MATITKTVYLCEDSYGSRLVLGSDMSDYGYLIITTSEVTFEVPDDIDFSHQRALSIDRQISAVELEYDKKIQSLRDAKAKILSARRVTS